MTSRPVAEQVQLITLGATTDSDDGAAFIQVLQQYTRHTFGPLVRSSEPTSQVIYVDIYYILRIRLCTHCIVLCITYRRQSPRRRTKVWYPCSARSES